MAAGLENRTLFIIFVSVQLLFGGAIGKLKCRGLVNKKSHKQSGCSYRSKNQNQLPNSAICCLFFYPVELERFEL